MSDTHVYEEGKFFGCYCLRSLNERYKGRTYIGFTVNPNRRIKQHNSGYLKGGAKRTSGKGPWEMVLIVHGFPNEISALRFEWAWTYPERSLRLKHLVPKTRQFNFVFKFNVLCEMLRIGPWCRLPLTIRWLKQEYLTDFPLNKQPPTHMPIEFGLVQIVSSKAKKPPKSNSSSSLSQIASSSQISSSQSAYTGLEICFICKQSVLKTSESVLNKSSALLKCLKCLGPFHTICLAENFLAETNQILPVDGDCPKCGTYLIWGELILFQKDNYKIRDCGSSGPEQDEDTDSEEFIEKDDDDDMNDFDDLDDL